MNEVARIKNAEIIHTLEDERIEGVYYIVKSGVPDVEALRLLTENYPVMMESRDLRLKAKYMCALGITYDRIAEREGIADYIDRALIEFAGASSNYEAVGDKDIAGCTENNIARILTRLGRYEDARASVTKARKLLTGNTLKLAVVDHTESEICLREGNRLEALRLSSKAISVFAEYEETELIAEAAPTAQKALVDFIATT